MPALPTAAREQGAEFFERAIGPHPGGIFRDAHRGTDLGVRTPLQESQYHREAIAFRQFVNRGVEHEPQPIPFGCGPGRVGRFQRDRGVLALLPPPVGDHQVDRHVAGCRMQPPI